MEILRDRREEFDRAGVKPLGVSRDSPYTHVSWMQALDLNFGLLSDWNAEAVQGFGVSRDFRGFKDIARRAAFLVDGEGTVRATWSYEDAEVPDFDELIRAAQAL
jgi:glutaredoxin-dependent peroxiredoxin